MVWIDALFGSSGDMCDRIGHWLEWRQSWDCYVCLRCGLTIRKPDERP